MGGQKGPRPRIGSEVQDLESDLRSQNPYLRGAPQGGSGVMCYVQNSLACYVLCKFLFTLLCEIKIGCYAEA